MKIFIDRAPVTGPWGGGNKTVTELTNQLREAGAEVIHHLGDEDIDIIFCFDPRPNKFGLWYQHYANYKSRYGCKIIQRVGDLGTHGKPELTELVRQSIKFSDFLIFPSAWAKEWIGYDGANSLVINNAPMKIFHKFKRNTELTTPINLVTHHWSTNVKKGFSFYKKLDEFVGANMDFQFTFIGRIPEGFKFKNSKYIEPIGNNEHLAELMAHSDIYVTASEEEAGANHVLEAVASGLPILFHESGGSIVNYCKDYGLPFGSFQTFQDALVNMKDSYNDHKRIVMEYDNDIVTTVEKYRNLIWKIAKK